MIIWEKSNESTCPRRESDKPPDLELRWDRKDLGFEKWSTCSRTSETRHDIVYSAVLEIWSLAIKEKFHVKSMTFRGFITEIYYPIHIRSFLPWKEGFASRRFHLTSLT